LGFASLLLPGRGMKSTISIFGQYAVRDELTEKVLAYNCCRIILMRKRRLEEMKRAA
jgi:hypothetical protein